MKKFLFIFMFFGVVNQSFADYVVRDALGDYIGNSSFPGESQIYNKYVRAPVVINATSATTATVTPSVLFSLRSVVYKDASCSGLGFVNVRGMFSFDGMYFYQGWTPEGPAIYRAANPSVETYNSSVYKKSGVSCELTYPQQTNLIPVESFRKTNLKTEITTPVTYSRY